MSESPTQHSGEVSACGRSRQRPVLLFVAPYFPPAYYGGVVQVYLSLLRRLTQYQVVTVADIHHSENETQTTWDSQAAEMHGFRVRRIDAFELHLRARKVLGRARLFRPFLLAEELTRFFYRGKQQWKKLLSDIQPDLVVCGGTYSAGWLMRHLPDSIPLVNYLHGEELTMQITPRIMMLYMRFRQMQSIRRAALNLAVSSYTAQLTQLLAHADSSTIQVFPNFVDTARFSLSGRRGELRERFGWQNLLVILTLARLEARKGIDQALRALSVLEREGSLPANWMYVIAGRGSELEALDLLTRQLNLTDHVVFPGFIADDEIAKLYEAADIFLQPNREIDGDTEGFGIVFLEASACGLPVIGGTAGGTADAIEEGVSGYRVDGESLEAIAGAISKLASDADLRVRLGAQGATRVAQHFTLEKAAARFSTLLDNVLDRYQSQAR